MTAKLVILAIAVSTLAGCATTEKRVRADVANLVEKELRELQTLVTYGGCDNIISTFDHYIDQLKTQIIK